MGKLENSFKAYITDDADAVAEDIVNGKSAYINGGKQTGIYAPKRGGFSNYYNSSVNKTLVNLTGNNQFTVFCSVSGVREIGTSNRRVLRIKSPSGYSTLSIEVGGSTYNSSLVFFRADSVNTAILYNRTEPAYSTPSYDVSDGGRYNVFWASDRTNDLELVVINGVEVSTTWTTRTTGAFQTGNHTLEFAQTGSTQQLRSTLSHLGMAKGYYSNWQDFMYSNGDWKDIDTSGWTEFGGAQPLVYSPDGDPTVQNSGSVGLFAGAP